MSDPVPDALIDEAIRIHAVLERRGETLSTAESLTGGRLADLLSAAPGSSRSYVGGVVAYATSVKAAVLGVPAALVEEHGVVSAECARAMAEGARRVTGATYGLATTGVAGPDEQDGMRVGTVYVAMAGPGGTTSRRLALDGDRQEVRRATCAAALSALSAILTEEESGLG